MLSRDDIVRGINDKPASTSALIESFLRPSTLSGRLYIGFPIVGSQSGKFSVDALYVSEQYGIVAFDLVDGANVDGYEQRQDQAYTNLHSRLYTHAELVSQRKLSIELHTITYAPAIADHLTKINDPHAITNDSNLLEAIMQLTWAGHSEEIFERALSAIQSISTIRKPKSARQPLIDNSLGARIQKIEDSVATLDSHQSRAVIETVEGVQRIRGLAGSGKTVVLALKAAYLHVQHPDWRIAVTFNTRSLKPQFRRLINLFCIDQSGEEPNWEQIRVLNAWGAPGGGERDGIYHEFCESNGIEYLNFGEAKLRYSYDGSFQEACALALSQVETARVLYQAVLVDEAQDFPPEFLKLCYESLDENKRLVYAYDELQTLSGEGLPPAEEIFGSDSDGSPMVTFDSSGEEVGARRDVILEKCYRNSKPILVSAHALGFGIYRKPSAGSIGLVQMFKQPELWTEIGYISKSGRLVPGKQAILARTPETSPVFLEDHSPIDELIQFKLFNSEGEQSEWVAAEIERNLNENELDYDDIVVINTDPVTTRKKLGLVRAALLTRKIPNHLAGVDTTADTFFHSDRKSITCTGVHRAKGNEAAMVYVINAQECHSNAANLARVRNRLFTAMTRSKAWLRVTGVGDSMKQLIDEYDAVKEARFELQFQYPSLADLDQLQLIHRDISPLDAKQLENQQLSLLGLLDAFETGKVFQEDLGEDVLKRLRRIINREET